MSVAAAVESGVIVGSVLGVAGGVVASAVGAGVAVGEVTVESVGGGVESSAWAASGNALASSTKRKTLLATLGWSEGILYVSVGRYFIRRDLNRNYP